MLSQCTSSSVRVDGTVIVRLIVRVANLGRRSRALVRTRSYAVVVHASDPSLAASRPAWIAGGGGTALTMGGSGGGGGGGLVGTAASIVHSRGESVGPRDARWPSPACLAWCTSDGRGLHPHRHELAHELGGRRGDRRPDRGCRPVRTHPGTQTDQFGRPFMLPMNTEIATTSACRQLRSVWPPPARSPGPLLTARAPSEPYQCARATVETARRASACARSRSCTPGSRPDRVLVERQWTRRGRGRPAHSGPHAVILPFAHSMFTWKSEPTV